MKKIFSYVVATIVLVCTSMTLIAQEKLPQFGKDPIKEIIKKMTIEEKAKVVVGKGFSGPGVESNDKTPDRLPAISGHTIPIPRFGIPSISMVDGPSGVHRFVMSAKDSADHAFATAWPVGTLIASSWDTTLVHNVGIAFGDEVRAYGIDFILGPGANIHRNPLGGRNFEYYSEDPLLSGATAAAMINGIQSNGVGATIKHFAANNQETNRNSVNTIVSERALREIYLRSFEIAVKRSHPWTIMSSYNLLNGSFTSESRDLLTTVLRDDWHYQGFVMSDWFAGKDAAAQIKAGNDLLMPGTPAQLKAVIEAVKSGKISEQDLDRDVEHVLTVLQHTLTEKKYNFSNNADLAKHALIARNAAAESMVLLKNSNRALPFSGTTKTIALFGNNGYQLIAGGTGSGDVNKAYTVSLAEGLTNAGYQLNQQVAQNYENYLSDFTQKHPKKSAVQEMMNPSKPAPERKPDQSLINADASDAAIVYIGRNAGEGADRKVEDDYELTEIETNTITEVSDAFHAKHKSVIVVLNIGGVIDVTAFRDKVDAILLAWQPGQEGGNAMADVLSGKVNPSGKLATTFPAAYTDVPSAKTFPGKETSDKVSVSMIGRSVPSEVIYNEGIYVGYRYYSSFKVKPAYEFGYGLSYTNFSYSNLLLSSTAFKGKLTATVTITNTGKVGGKEVAELYLTAPNGELDKPVEELKGFAKTKLLNPGESQVLTFTLNAIDLASFNAKQEAWIADAGQYSVKFGASSEDIKLVKTFNLAKTMVVEKVHKALTPQVTFDELKK